MQKIEDERVVAIAKMTARGQVVIPEEIRIAMDLKDGSYFVVSTEPSGKFLVMAPFEPREIASFTVGGTSE